MIKKSLICFAILAVLHLGLVLLNPSMGTATHQWQDNVLKAQQFMYAEKSDTVMVGTSLSGRIIRDSIPFVKSVSFGGCSVEDGLKIILSKGDAPRFILVETNYLLQNGNDELVSNISKGIFPVIRGWIPSLQEQYEPICIFASLIMSSTNINPQAGMATVNMDLLNESINRQLEGDYLLPKETVESRLQVIKKLIYELEEKGTQFVFFEMPVNERLFHMKRSEQMREIMHKEFPVDKYIYLPFDTTKYLTTDGEHLDYEGQQRYSHYLKKIMENIRL
jgi:hypothetical protein